MKPWLRIVLEIALHLAFWGTCFWILMSAFAFTQMEVFEQNGLRREVYSVDYRASYFFFAALLAKAALVYSNAFWLLPRYLRHRRIGRYFAELALALAAMIALELSFNLAFSRFVEGYSLTFVRQFGGLNFVLLLTLGGLSVAYRFTLEWRRSERLKARLLEEKLGAELNYLKTQIHPHFLFNTLNNLFALAERERQSELAHGIAGLAELMRYMLYDGRLDRVLLEKEVQVLQSIVEVHQLRFSEEDELVVSTEVEGRYRGRTIAPLLLVPFVENAFKHGVRPGRSSFIRIRLEVRERTLSFEVVNSDHGDDPSPHAVASGIGLENVRRRLELLYPGRHSLSTGRHGDRYEIKLEVQLD